MIGFLRDKGYLSLSSIVGHGASSTRGQGCISVEDVSFRGDECGIWSGYISNLNNNNVRIQVSNDSLVSMHSPTWVYAPKFGYMYLI